MQLPKMHEDRRRARVEDLKLCLHRNGNRRQGVDAVLGGAKPRWAVTVDERLASSSGMVDVELSTPN